MYRLLHLGQLAAGRVLRAVGLNSLAARAFKAAIDSRPDDALGHVRLAETFITCKRLEEAAGSYEAAATLRPLDLSETQALGWVYAEMQRVGDARNLFEAFLRDHPEEPECFAFLGWTHLRSGEPERAHEWLVKAVEAMPGDDWAWSTLGSACFALERFDEAVRAFRHAAELNPESVDTFAGWAAAELRLDQAPAALQAARAAVGANPTQPAAHQLLAAVREAAGESPAPAAEGEGASGQTVGRRASRILIRSVALACLVAGVVALVANLAVINQIPLEPLREDVVAELTAYRTGHALAALAGIWLMAAGSGLLLRKAWGWRLAFSYAVYGVARSLVTLVPGTPGSHSLASSIGPAALYFVALFLLSRRGPRAACGAGPDRPGPSVRDLALAGAFAAAVERLGADIILEAHGWLWLWSRGWERLLR